MIDDNKHTERVPVYLTDREFIATCRLAVAADKTPAEYIRYVLRLALYGSVGIARFADHQFRGADSAPNNPNAD